MKSEKSESVQNNVQQEVQKLTVSLSVDEWNAVLSVIEQSTSPHIQVKSVAGELINQLQPQVTEDAK
jgi:hypothetical protein